MKKMMRTTALGGALVFMVASAHAMDDGFMVGNTTFKIGGYVDLDVHMTEYSNGTTPANRIDRDMYIPSLTPTAADGDSSEHFDMTAETSRLSFTAMNGGTKGYIEIDFLGDNANERVSNSHRPRIRRAFIKNGNWLMGQEWSTYQNLSAIPESASFLAASDGQIFVRQQMVRWTNGPLQIALENPGESRVRTTEMVDVVTFENVDVDVDTNNDGDTEDTTDTTITVQTRVVTPTPRDVTNTVDQAERPDIVVRCNYKADFGNISASLLNRQITHGDFEEDAISFSVAGRVKAGPGDVRFSYSAGEGMGRYIGLHAANEVHTVTTGTGDAARQRLELVESTGIVAAYRLPLGNDGARLNVGISSLEVDDPQAGQLETVSSSYVAYLWNPAPKVTYGVEYLQGTRENEGGAEGDIDRFTFSAKYAF